MDKYMENLKPSSETQMQLEGGEKKSKRARKNIRAKKSQERGEEPLETRF